MPDFVPPKYTKYLFYWARVVLIIMFAYGMVLVFGQHNQRTTGYASDSVYELSEEHCSCQSTKKIIKEY